MPKVISSDQILFIHSLLSSIRCFIGTHKILILVIKVSNKDHFFQSPYFQFSILIPKVCQLKPHFYPFLLIRVHLKVKYHFRV